LVRFIAPLTSGPSEDRVREIYGEIVAQDEEAEVTTVIGKVIAYVITVSGITEEEIQDVFDQHDDAMLKAGRDLQDAGVLDVTFRLLYVADIELDPRWRRRELGLTTLTQAITMLGGDCDLVALVPAHERLADYWAKLGFTQLDGRDTMVLDLG
jgi:hypothetical protein